MSDKTAGNTFFSHALNATGKKRYLALITTSTSWYFCVVTTGLNNVVYPAPSNNTWQMITLSAIDSNIKFYVNGGSPVSKTISGNEPNSTINVKLGSPASNKTQMINDVIFWNKVLTGEEVTSLYNAQLPFFNEFTDDMRAINDIDWAIIDTTLIRSVI